MNCKIDSHFKLSRYHDKAIKLQAYLTWGHGQELRLGHGPVYSAEDLLAVVSLREHVYACAAADLA